MSEQQQRTVVVHPQGDSRPIIVMGPCVTDELNTDRGDILDLVSKKNELSP